MMLAVPRKRRILRPRRFRRRLFANDNDALIPELWARYSVAILESNMVAGNLVYRDFENELAQFGDTVNTRKPTAFTAKRKTDADTVTVQDAISTNIAVKLDMHPHVSFLIKDGEESLSMKSLVEFYLQPAMIAMAEHIDACILGQFPRFLVSAGQAGQLGGLTSSNYQAYLTELGERLDVTKAPIAGRQLVVPPSIKKKILQNQPLVGADQRGDGGTALENARMGRIYGFEHYMCQNMSSFLDGDAASSTFLLNGAAAKGATALTVDTGSGVAGVAGNWLKVGGKVYQIASTTETTADTTTITLKQGLQEAVADNSPVTVYDEALVNNAAGYAAGYAKAITYDGTTLPLRTGQFVSFGTLETTYTIIEATTTTIVLDRPLEAAITDNSNINPGPGGDYGFAFQRESVALVVRPLKMPRAGAGALAGAASHNGFSVRVVITYDGDKQGHLVTVDCLMGIQVLDSLRGAVLLG